VEESDLRDLLGDAVETAGMLGELRRRGHQACPATGALAWTATIRELLLTW
jgi:hypothetical protein